MVERSLPPIEDFFNSLTNSPCSKEDYAYAQGLWRKLGCETLKDFLMAYLRTDVLLLTDIFENFRNICMQYYKSDPCYYFTARFHLMQC